MASPNEMEYPDTIDDVLDMPQLLKIMRGALSGNDSKMLEFLVQPALERQYHTDYSKLAKDFPLSNAAKKMVSSLIEKKDTVSWDDLTATIVKDFRDAFNKTILKNFYAQSKEFKRYHEKEVEKAANKHFASSKKIAQTLGIEANNANMAALDAIRSNLVEGNDKEAKDKADTLMRANTGRIRAVKVDDLLKAVKTNKVKAKPVDVSSQKLSKCAGFDGSKNDAKLTALAKQMCEAYQEKDMILLRVAYGKIEKALKAKGGKVPSEKEMMRSFVKNKLVE
ncbi:hypothetical protein [Rhizobium halophytocola]|uniref:DUF3102 domain-containing protein n=1 Tax=Rhizobium halophytocola TaxID=735519 RepID=A0ABS4E5I3_9HYPH|nr:hypothetical protein [Rhizobium halophytocola]MBP1853214.1 hypothetical protein [Rhizobium halophytocola]